MKRPDSPTGPHGAEMTPAKGTLFSQLPRVWEMFTDSKYDDGTKRKRSTLLFVADGAAAKVCICDGDLNRQAWVSAETWEQALSVLEDKLEAGTVTW